MVNNAICLNISSITPLYPIDQVQLTPQSKIADVSDATTGFGMAIGALISVASVLMSNLLLNPLVWERLQEVTQAVLRVGVRLRT
jgi:hypothetical protein